MRRKKERSNAQSQRNNFGTKLFVGLLFFPPSLFSDSQNLFFYGVNLYSGERESERGLFLIIGFLIAAQFLSS